MNVEIWHLATAVCVFLLGVAGLVVMLVRIYLLSFAKGQTKLFDFANESRDRIQQLEKFAIATNIDMALRFIAERKDAP